MKKLYLWITFVWVISLSIFGYFTLFGLTRSHPRFIEIILFGKQLQSIYRKMFTKPYTALRNYEHIYFTGEKNIDKIKLDFARVRVHEIIRQQDTLNGIHFSFGDSARFSNLVQTLDLLRAERAQRYIIASDGIWFLEIMEPVIQQDSLIKPPEISL